VSFFLGWAEVQFLDVVAGVEVADDGLHIVARLGLPQHQNIQGFDNLEDFVEEEFAQAGGVAHGVDDEFLAEVVTAVEGVEVADGSEVGLQVVEGRQLPDPNLLGGLLEGEADAAVEAAVLADVTVQQHVGLRVDGQKVLAQGALPSVFGTHQHGTVPLKDLRRQLRKRNIPFLFLLQLLSAAHLLRIPLLLHLHWLLLIR
jgi:hypothetical protein